MAKSTYRSVVACRNNHIPQIVKTITTKRRALTGGTLPLKATDGLAERLDHVARFALDAGMRPLAVVVADAHEIRPKDLTVLVKYLRTARHLGISYVLGYPTKKSVQPVVQDLAREMVFPKGRAAR